MYSVTSKTSFDRIKNFKEQIYRVKELEFVPICIVGNKSDAEDLREVSKEDGLALAKEMECEFIETSAKTSLNVEKPFLAVARLLRDIRRENDPSDTKKKKKKTCILL